MKEKILSALVAQLQAEVKHLEDTALKAAEAATHEESRAEDQHDTRGIEASYLAAEYAKRVEDLRRTIHALAAFHPRPFQSSDAIAVGALVTGKSGEQMAHWLLCPWAGGHKVEISSTTVQILSTQSALGMDLLDKSEGDEVRAGLKNWVITKIE